MSFSFDFSEQELNNDEQLSSGNEPRSQETIQTNPLDTVEITCPPQIITLKEILPTLIDTRISYESLQLGTKHDDHIYKRELFDVKQQLMVEDNFKDKSQDELFKILIGDTYEDLKNGVYEGGLKSWECSYDMIKELDTMDLDISSFNSVELGCGTSLPSLYLFSKVIEDRLTHGRGQATFILSDYNYEVLRLVSLPNMLVNWCKFAISDLELKQLQGSGSSNRKDEIYVSEDLANAFMQWLDSHSIQIVLISGSWGREFMNEVHKILPNMEEQKNLILTSETIYSPKMLPVVGEMVLQLTYGTEPLTIVTAKDIYFGVGGSVNQLIQYMQERNNGLPANKRLNWQVLKVNSHLKRSIIKIRRILA